MTQRWIIVLVVGMTACGKTDDKDKPTVASSGKEGTGKDKPAPKRGGDTGEAAAQAMFDAIVAGDLDAAKRMVPDADACKSIPDLKPCPQIAGRLEKSWPQLKTTGASFAKSKLKVTKSTEPSPVPNGELWTATGPGMEPLVFVAFKAGDRFYAPVFAGGGAKPPSTGNEMPAKTAAMKPEQARAIVDEAVKLAEQPKPNCEQIVDALSTALPIAFPGATIPKEAEAGLRAWGKCASAAKRWRAVVQAGSALLQLSDDEKAPQQIVRALAEMGEYDKAIATANDFAKKYPKARPGLAGALTFVYCRAEAWDACVKSGEAAIAALTTKANLAPTDDAVLINRVLRDLAWIVIGKPKEALADLAAIEKVKGAPPPAIAKIKDEATRAIERGFYFEAITVPQLPTGVYHLMGRKDTGALVTIKIHNHTNAARKFRVEVEVPGVTERSANAIELKAKEATLKWANPPLKMDFNMQLVRSPRPSQLALKIVEVGNGDKTVIDETLQIEVLPRDYLPLRRKVGADSMVPTYGYMGAWVTSNDKTVEQFLTKAKERLPSRSFVGEQDTTVPQIKAIFDELKSRGVSYVMDPSVTADQTFVQRTRLPAEVLASTNAQCLEGTLLFATLMETIGVKPIIVLVPGHAFVGWRTVPKDGTKGEPLFVETTMVGGAPFEAAVDVATKRVAKELKNGSFKSGASTFVDLAAIRKAGFTAQPQ